MVFKDGGRVVQPAVGQIGSVQSIGIVNAQVDLFVFQASGELFEKGEDTVGVSHQGGYLGVAVEDPQFTQFDTHGVVFKFSKQLPYRMSLTGLFQIQQFAEDFISSKWKWRLLANCHAQLVVHQTVTQPTFEPSQDLSNSFLLSNFQFQFSTFHSGQLHCNFLRWTSLERRSLQNPKIQFSAIASNPKNPISSCNQGLGINASDCQLSSNSSKGTVEGFLSRMQQISSLQLLIIVGDRYDGLICCTVATETGEVTETRVQPNWLPYSEAVGDQVSSFGYLGVTEKDVKEDCRVAAFELQPFDFVVFCLVTTQQFRERLDFRHILELWSIQLSEYSLQSKKSLLIDPQNLHAAVRQLKLESNQVEYFENFTGKLSFNHTFDKYSGRFGKNGRFLHVAVSRWLCFLKQRFPVGEGYSATGRNLLPCEFVAVKMMYGFREMALSEMTFFLVFEMQMHALFLSTEQYLLFQMQAISQRYDETCLIQIHPQVDCFLLEICPNQQHQVGEDIQFNWYVHRLSVCLSYKVPGL